MPDVDELQTFRTLFDSIDEGVAISEMIYGDDGEIVDMVFRHVNRAYEEQGGVSDVIGRSKFDVLPNVEDHWLETYKRVAKTGEPVRIENYQQDVDRWFDVLFTRLDDEGRFVAIVFKNITEGKHADEALRASEQRQGFLLRLNDALRGGTDARQVEQLALDMLADQLSVDRAYITTSDYGKGETEVPAEVRRGELPPLVGIFRHADFPESAQQVNEGTFVVDDVETDTSLSELNRRSFAAFQIKAVIGVGLRKGVSDIFWTLAVAMSEPRNWSPNEVLLMEEAAERIWAAIERARAEAALRESERLRSAMLDVLPLALGMINPDGTVLWSNSQWDRFVPRLIPSRDEERRWRWRSWDQDGQLVQPSDFPNARALRGETVVPAMEFLYTEDDGRETWTSVAAVPVTDGDGNVTGAVSIIQDIDAAKRAVDLQRTLLAELQHRVRNVLSMVRSIVRRSSQTKSDLNDFVQHLEGRIDAMARTQAQLTRTPGKLIQIEDLVRDEMVAQSSADGKFAVYGPPTRLSPHAAEVLTLALHELATNSVKYGALGSRDGRITINWEVEQDPEQPRLQLAWHETGLPAQPVGEGGFGTELITRRVPYELKGRGEMVFADGSLTATIEFPLRDGSSILETSPMPWKRASHERNPPAQ